MKKYIKKYYFLIFIVIIGILRYLLSYKLPSFYLGNLYYDDKLMIKELNSLLGNNYLGDYSPFSLIKGIIFPIIIYYARLLEISYSSVFSFLYITACIYFIYSLQRIIKNKKFLLFMYIILLFNPVTYSGELFQRLYINTISITELMFFWGAVIRFITPNQNELVDSIVLGSISSIMLLTRNDNLWIYIVLFILLIHKLYKRIKVKSIVNGLVPFIIVIIGFNLLSFINYTHYGVYSYNELEDTYFKDAYNKVLEIKSDNVYDKVSITKDMLYKLCDNSKVFNFTHEEIDKKYKSVSKTSDGEIDNGNILWFFRSIIYRKEKFENGKEANEYFHKLSDELDLLFENNKLERKSSLPSVFLNIPNKNELKSFPKSIIEALVYTTTFKNVKTYSKNSIESLDNNKYMIRYKAYNVYYSDYRHAEEMVKYNEIKYEIIRIIYKSFTIVFSFISLFIYFKNIRKKDKLNLLIHLIVLIYLIILCGVVYTHVTAFHAIRYRYLSNVYILQSLFILLNIYRVVNKKGVIDNDISNNTSIQRGKINTKYNKKDSKSIKRK